MRGKFNQGNNYLTGVERKVQKIKFDTCEEEKHRGIVELRK